MDFDAAALTQNRTFLQSLKEEKSNVFETADLQAVSPAFLSGLGYCLAREKGDLQQAIVLCREALRRAPEEPLHYLHLGRVYLRAGKKHLALHTFRRGLKHGQHRGLLKEIRRLGFRRPPVFPFLGRKHPVNKLAGIVFSRLGWR